MHDNPEAVVSLKVLQRDSFDKDENGELNTQDTDKLNDIYDTIDKEVKRGSATQRIQDFFTGLGEDFSPDFGDPYISASAGGYIALAYNTEQAKQDIIDAQLYNEDIPGQTPEGYAESLVVLKDYTDDRGAISVEDARVLIDTGEGS